MKVSINNGLINQPITERKPTQLNTGDVSASKSATVDRTTLSSASTSSTSVASLTKQAMQAPEIRQDKVNALRSAVSSGTYQLNTTKIAEAVANGN